jgi:hypothetical protein
VLEDAYLNTATVLNPNGTTTVNFTVSSGAGSGAGNRFRIVFRAAAPGPLPVTFISISANRKNAGVDIAWKVAAERNVKNYQLQRSADGIHFGVVATVMALGNSSVDHDYVASDETAPSTVVFYRINSVDKDGQNKYSSIIKVKAGDTRQGFSILSNPIQDGIINVQFSNQLAGRYSLQLINSGGQNIMKAIVNHKGGNSNQLVNLPASITNGTYWLLVTTPDNTSSVQALVINNR